ncbi:MAG: hypothetical protein RL139_1303 [Gemmatimonadota bacterium]
MVTGADRRGEVGAAGVEAVTCGASGIGMDGKIWGGETLGGTRTYERAVPNVSESSMSRRLATLLLCLLSAGTAAAQEHSTWRWSGPLAAGRTVIVRNLNGAINLEPSTGNTVEVVAEKEWNRGDPNRVRVEARMMGGGSGDLLVCALWGADARCDERGYSHGGERGASRGWRDGDVAVRFTIKVPAGTRVRANTSNGSITATGTTGDLDAKAVNGHITARPASGRVSASTVNGSITARTTAGPPGTLEFTTVNGSVTLELAATINADVDLSVVNGTIRSDLPVLLNGELNRRHISARIGTGGPGLKVSTVNGSITIHRI